MRIGAHYLGEGKCEFIVWAPFSEDLKLKIVSPEDRMVSMNRDRQGYWRTVTGGVTPGTRYLYKLNSAESRPDPASNLQPAGVHEASEVVDHTAFHWTDKEWRGIALDEMIIYELHIGTFTPEGTFDAVIGRLDALRSIGVNAIEIMPVAQFPGERNWGYDGAYPFAVQNSYCGPEGLKRLVSACHARGLAVILDVVYNHLGPEGNYLGSFGPYFTPKYKTPWGNAINFDDAHCREVRNYFIENALYWFRHYHIDALRLDAVHAIYDNGPYHILRELADITSQYSKTQGRKFYLIAESDLNDPKVVRSSDAGGYGIDAQWCDDFHHSLRTIITGEQRGYFSDYGRIDQLAKAYKEGFVYSGQFSRFRDRAYGASSKDIQGHRLIVFSQNHDQVGNRMLGERLTLLVSFEELKLAAAAVFVSPYIPMLFMGEEYAERSPFLYFVSHSDSDLITAVREGRKAEFASFRWQGEPPDPQGVEVFLKSKLNWHERTEGEHNVMLKFYERLIEMRKTIPALASLNKDSLEACVQEPGLLLLRRWKDASHILCVMNFNKNDAAFYAPPDSGAWGKIFDSAEECWGGPGSVLPARIDRGESASVRANAFALFQLEK